MVYTYAIAANASLLLPLTARPAFFGIKKVTTATGSAGSRSRNALLRCNNLLDRGRDVEAGCTLQPEGLRKRLVSGKHAGGVLHACRYFAELVHAVTEAHFHLGQRLKVMANHVLIGHADATMQLHRLLTDKAHGMT